MDKVKTGSVSVHLVFGTVLHKVIEARAASSEKSLQGLFESLWEKHISDNINWYGDSRRHYERLAARMLRNKSIVDGLAAVEPLVLDTGKSCTEYFFRMRVHGRIPFVGYVDVVEADGVPADYKTAKRFWTQSANDPAGL